MGNCRRQKSAETWAGVVLIFFGLGGMPNSAGASEPSFDGIHCDQTLSSPWGAIQELRNSITERYAAPFIPDYSMEAFIDLSNVPMGRNYVATENARDPMTLLGDSSGLQLIQPRSSEERRMPGIVLQPSSQASRSSDAYLLVKQKLEEVLQARSQDPEKRIQVIIGRDALPLLGRALAEILSETELGRTTQVTALNVTRETRSQLKEFFTLMISGDPWVPGARSSGSAPYQGQSAFKIDFGPGAIKVGPLQLKVGRDSSRIQFKSCLDKFFRPISDLSKCS